MDRENTITTTDLIEKSNKNVSKNIDNQSDSSNNFAILLAEIVIENLVRKYRGKYSNVSFKDASEVPGRLRNKDKEK